MQTIYQLKNHCYLLTVVFYFLFLPCLETVHMRRHVLELQTTDYLSMRSTPISLAVYGCLWFALCSSQFHTEALGKRLSQLLVMEWAISKMAFASVSKRGKQGRLCARTGFETEAHGSEAFGSKLQIFQVSFVPQFPKEPSIQRKQHQI